MKIRTVNNNPFFIGHEQLEFADKFCYLVSSEDSAISNMLPASNYLEINQSFYQSKLTLTYLSLTSYQFCCKAAKPGWQQ